MSNDHVYNVRVRWDADRKGTLDTPEIPVNIEVATPPSFPKGMEGYWTPEHLFVAAVNSCLMTTFLAIAENSKLQYQSFESEASGKLELVDGKYMMSEVTLTPLLVVTRQQDADRAMRILEKSEAACLISNSIKSTIVFRPRVEVVEMALG